MTTLMSSKLIRKMPMPPNTELTLALMLAITAPDDERANKATQLAESLTVGMDAATVESCKTAASAMNNLVNARKSLMDLAAAHDLNGDDDFHDAMRAITFAVERLGVSVEAFASFANA